MQKACKVLGWIILLGVFFHSYLKPHQDTYYADGIYGPDVYFYADEHLWIQSGFWSFEQFFFNTDFDSQFWNHEYMGVGRRNPNLAKFLIGFSVWAWNGSLDQGMTWYPWDFFLHEFDDPWLSAQGYIPDGNILLPPRLLVGFFALGCSILLYFCILLILQKPGPAFLGAILFLLNPFIMNRGHYLNLDIFTMFFQILFLYALLYTAKNGLSGDLRTLGFRTLQFGIVAGLATSCKLNGALCVIQFTVLLPILMDDPVEVRKSVLQKILKMGGTLLLFFGVTGVIFLLLHPQLYQDTLSGLYAMYQLKEVVKQNPRAFYFWSEALTKCLYHYSIDPNMNTLFRLTRFPIDAVLVCLGLTFGLPALPNRNIKILLSIFSILVLLSIIWWVRNDWEAYYLPLLPVLIIWQVIGLSWVAQRFLKRGSPDRRL